MPPHGHDGYRGGRGSGGGAARGVGELDGGPRQLVVVVIVAPAAGVPGCAASHDPREALRGGARGAVLRAGAGAGADPRAAARRGGRPGAAEGPRPRVAVDRGELLRGSAGRRLRAAAAGLVVMRRRLRVEAPPRRVTQPAAARARRPRQAIHGSVRGFGGRIRWGWGRRKKGRDERARGSLVRPLRRQGRGRGEAGV